MLFEIISENSQFFFLFSGRIADTDLKIKDLEAQVDKDKTITLEAKTKVFWYFEI